MEECDHPQKRLKSVIGDYFGSGSKTSSRMLHSEKSTSNSLSFSKENLARISNTIHSRESGVFSSSNSNNIAKRTGSNAMQDEDITIRLGTNSSFVPPFSSSRLSLPSNNSFGFSSGGTVNNISTGLLSSGSNHPTSFFGSINNNNAHKNYSSTNSTSISSLLSAPQSNTLQSKWDWNFGGLSSLSREGNQAGNNNSQSFFNRTNETNKNAPYNPVNTGLNGNPLGNTLERTNNIWTNPPQIASGIYGSILGGPLTQPQTQTSQTSFFKPPQSLPMLQENTVWGKNTTNPTNTNTMQQTNGFINNQNNTNLFNSNNMVQGPSRGQQFQSHLPSNTQINLNMNNTQQSINPVYEVQYSREELEHMNNFQIMVQNLAETVAQKEKKVIAEEKQKANELTKEDIDREVRMWSVPEIKRIEEENAKYDRYERLALSQINMCKRVKRAENYKMHLPSYQHSLKRMAQPMNNFERIAEARIIKRKTETKESYGDKKEKARLIELFVKKKRETESKVDCLKIKYLIVPNSSRLLREYGKENKRSLTYKDTFWEIVKKMVNRPSSINNDQPVDETQPPHENEEGYFYLDRPKQDITIEAFSDIISSHLPRGVPEIYFITDHILETDPQDKISDWFEMEGDASTSMIQVGGIEHQSEDTEATADQEASVVESSLYESQAEEDRTEEPVEVSPDLSSIIEAGAFGRVKGLCFSNKFGSVVFVNQHGYCKVKNWVDVVSVGFMKVDFDKDFLKEVRMSNENDSRRIIIKVSMKGIPENRWCLLDSFIREKFRVEASFNPSDKIVSYCLDITDEEYD